MNCLGCNQPVAALHEQNCPRAGLFRKRVTEDDTVERVRPEIQALIRRGNVTLAEIQEIRCNSWEWESLVPAFDDEAFVDRMQYALDNCAQSKTRPFTVYDDAVKGLYAPELLKRFKERMVPKNRCQACSIESEIGTEENPHPVPSRFHTCPPTYENAEYLVHVFANDVSFSTIGTPGKPPRDDKGRLLCWTCNERPAVGMSCGGPVCAVCAHSLPFTSFPLNGLLCPVCRLPQRNTSGGASCENGHGGEVGEEP